MAEIQTALAAKLIANQKLRTTESFGRVRILSTAMPATYASQATGTTILIGRIPGGAKILTSNIVSCAAGTASSTLDIGLRTLKDGTVIDADGIAAAVNIAAAGLKAANTGALIANGVEYITPEAVEVYATVGGAALAANQALKFEIQYVAD